MRIYTEEIFIPNKNLKLDGLSGIRNYYKSKLKTLLPLKHKVVRFVVTETKKDGYNCELDIIDPQKSNEDILSKENIFDFNKRTYENTKQFNAVFDYSYWNWRRDWWTLW
jgi:hypothetical protein